MTSKINSFTAFSWKGILSIGLPYVAAFFSPIAVMISAVCFLTMFDTITGIWAAHKRGEKVHSRAMGRAVTKMLMYSLVIILAHVMELVFIAWVPMVNLAAGYVALVEFKSNMENIGYITDTDIWTYIREKMDAFKPRLENKDIIEEEDKEENNQ